MPVQAQTTHDQIDIRIEGFILENNTTHWLQFDDILKAARPLTERGAKIALYLIEGGSEANFNRNLRSDGLVINDRPHAQLIAIYVSPGAYTEIRVGSAWADMLTPLEGVKSTYVDRNVSERAYDLAFIRPLEVLSDRLVLAGVKPLAPQYPAYNPGYHYRDDDPSLPFVANCFIFIFTVTIGWLFPKQPRDRKKYYGGKSLYRSEAWPEPVLTTEQREEIERLSR